MIDVTQILSTGSAAANASRSGASQPGDASAFGDALSRARQTGNDTARPAPSTAGRTDKPASREAKTDANGKTAAQPQARDTAATGERAAQAEQAAGKGTVRDESDNGDDAELAATDTVPDPAAAAAAAALLGTVPTVPPAAAPAMATGSAAGTAAAGHAALPGLPGVPTAAAGNTPHAAEDNAAASLAAQTLDTIAQQRAAASATGQAANAATAPAAAAAASAMPSAQPSQADAAQTTAQPAWQAALDARSAAAANDGSARQDGTDLGQSRHGAATHADLAVLRPAATDGGQAAAMQNAIAAASAQRQADTPAADNTNATAALAPAPTVAASHSQATAATASLPVAPRVGDAEWPQALSQQVVRLTTQGNHTAELQLNPPDLGPLKVVLNISNDQAQAQFLSPHASVRAAVEAALPQLRHAMADSGIQLGQTSVGADPQFAGQPQHGQQQPSPQGGQRFAQSGGEFGRQETLADTPAAPAPRRVALGEVDTFA